MLYHLSYASSRDKPPLRGTVYPTDPCLLYGTSLKVITTVLDAQPRLPQRQRRPEYLPAGARFRVLSLHSLAAFPGSQVAMRIRRRLPLISAVLIIAAALALAVVLRKHAPPEPARLLPGADCEVPGGQAAGL